MRGEARYGDRPWVAPEACSAAGRASSMSSDLRSSIEHAEHALDQASLRGIVHALVAVRAALRSRLGEGPTLGQGYSDHGRFSLGPWQRRLRRRYAASLCVVERLLKQVWTGCNLDALRPALRDELARLRRVESMETRAYLDQHWTDIGVGD